MSDELYALWQKKFSPKRHSRRRAEQTRLWFDEHIAKVETYHMVDNFAKYDGLADPMLTRKMMKVSDTTVLWLLEHKRVSGPVLKRLSVNHDIPVCEQILRPINDEVKFGNGHVLLMPAHPRRNMGWWILSV